jgi:hypothetical protein
MVTNHALGKEGFLEKVDRHQTLSIGKDYKMVIQHKHANKQQRFQYHTKKALHQLTAELNQANIE